MRFLRARSARAFTLVELLVVVIIIGVLSAVAAVSYNVFVARSQTQTARQDAVTVANKLTLTSAQDGTGSVAADYSGADTAGVDRIRQDAGIADQPNVYVAPDGAASVIVGYSAQHNCLVRFGDVAYVDACH